MVRKYEKLATWTNGVSFVALLGVLAFGVLTKHRFDPLPIILLLLGLAALIGSYAYLGLTPKLSPERKQQGLVKAIHFYRQLGFFAEFSQLSDERVAATLNARWREIHDGESFDPAPPDAEPELLSLDETRVWNSDLECDVCEENHVYSDIVKSIRAISRDAFAPEDIIETWETEEGPIRVEFSFNGGTHILRPKYHNDWLDTDFLFSLAKLFKGSGYELVIRPGDPVYATVLTADEKRRIRRERGSVF